MTPSFFCRTTRPNRDWRSRLLCLVSPDGWASRSPNPGQRQRGNLLPLPPHSVHSSSLHNRRIAVAHLRTGQPAVWINCVPISSQASKDRSFLLKKNCRVQYLVSFLARQCLAVFDMRGRTKRNVQPPQHKVHHAPRTKKDIKKQSY